jgi:IBR domain, a half RING-finger domain
MRWPDQILLIVRWLHPILVINNNLIIYFNNLRASAAPWPFLHVTCFRIYALLQHGRLSCIFRTVSAQIAVVHYEVGLLLCLQVRDWRKMLTQEQLEQNQESEEWLASHTQPCPSCSAKVQRTGGCNHMTCFVCGQHFCYICGQDWCVSAFMRRSCAGEQH